MPMYDYTCSSCSHKFELFCTMDDRNIPCDNPCPSCEKNTISKDIAAPSIGDPIRMGARKLDTGFKEVMKKISNGSPRNNMRLR